MAIRSITISNYRSLRNVYLPLERLNVITGPNGTGKSNLYRALYVLHQAANGRFARTLAEEGGMPSILWAGARKKGPVRLSLGVSFEDGLDYALECGLPEANDEQVNESEVGAFKRDPLLKSETITFRDGRSKVTLCERGKSGASLRDAEGARVSMAMTFGRTESVLSQLAEPHRYPHLSILRQRLLSWRFYHTFRTDEGSPVRQPQIGVLTPVLSHDGSDLAAALQTIVELGDAEGLFRAVRQGLNGAMLQIAVPEDGRFRIQLQTDGVLRPLEGWELSDGTLRYLCLLAALLSPRPPALLALNEPETSLHPDLLAPLAAHIVEASQRSQVWVTTHSEILTAEIERRSGVAPVTLSKRDGETHL